VTPETVAAAAGLAMQPTTKVLDAERGCTFVSVAFIAAIVISILYSLFSGSSDGNDAKKFRDACYDRYIQKYGTGKWSEEEETFVAIECDKELRAHLGTR
jgi:hypothetical protein